MLVSTLLLSSTLFSQTGISNKKEPVVCIPQSTAQKIAVDLLRLDSVSVELKSTQDVLHKTESKIVVQDSIIQTYIDKVKTYKKESAAQTERYELCAGRVTKLEQDVATLTESNRKLKNLAKGLGAGLATTFATIAFILVIK